MQCIYVAVMSSSYYMFVMEAHPLIPNAYVGAYHKCVRCNDSYTLFFFCLL